MFRDWSKQEVEATVRDYFDMLASELRGGPYQQSRPQQGAPCAAG